MESVINSGCEKGEGQGKIENGKWKKQDRGLRTVDRGLRVRSEE
jgi:hypothetical protein